MHRAASQATRKRRHKEANDAAMAPLDLDRVATVVAEAAAAMHADLAAPLATRLIGEIETLAQVIKAARSEISALDSTETRAVHFSTATDELDAVVGATEDATNAIMEAAERIEGVAQKLDRGPANELTRAVTAIYEACGFQDITGQRIGKVVDALRQIEVKVEGLLAVFGDERARARRDRLARELGRRQARDGGLLDGPRGTADAQNQDDIDAFFDGPE